MKPILTAFTILVASLIAAGASTLEARPLTALALPGSIETPSRAAPGDAEPARSGSKPAAAPRLSNKRQCRLSKPLIGKTPASLRCYTLAAFEARPANADAGKEKALLGEPLMDRDDEDFLEELEIPDGVQEAEEAVEVMRAWVADGALHVIFDPETFRHDVSEWGRLLGDVAQHIANAVEMDGQMPRQEALAKIHDAIDVSVASGAVTMDGRIKGRTEH